MDFLLLVLACRRAADRLASAVQKPKASAFPASFQLNYASKAGDCQ